MVLKLEKSSENNRPWWLSKNNRTHCDRKKFSKPTSHQHRIALMKTRLKIRPKMRQLKLKIMPSANCRVTTQTGVTRLTRPSRMTVPPGWPYHPRGTWPPMVTISSWVTRQTRVTRLTRKIFPLDRIREAWCKNCQTWWTANLQFWSARQTYDQGWKILISREPGS